jgi:hypothetical protein
MYTVLTRLGNGELILVASREDMNQAVRLAQSLNASWPREYVVRDPQGNHFIPDEIHRDRSIFLNNTKTQ